jgi:Tol biopolymer transport system component/DNA-binding winged helix-turn-helix (wHTH) protein
MSLRLTVFDQDRQSKWYSSLAAFRMEELKRRSLPVRFGSFEVDLEARELRRQGLKVKLQEQPFQVLVMLLERAGGVVTREELQRELWPADTFVDFERGLNRAVNKLRESLDDDAESPRFIETLPRRGYRFLAPVEAAELRESEAAGRSPSTVLRSDSCQAEDTASTPASSWQVVLPWVVAGVLAVVAVTSYWRPWRSSVPVPDKPFLQLDLNVGPDEVSLPTISADGKRIAFVSRGALSIRRLDQTNTTRLAGTEGAFMPFFSPNGQWIAFFAAGKLKKMAVDGGDPIALCDAPRPWGGTWDTDDNIFAALDVSKKDISRIPASGGVPQLLTNAKSDRSGALMYVSPQALPGRKGILLAALNGSSPGSLRVFTPNDGKLKTLVENSTFGRYLPSGYLVYGQDGGLFALRLDADRMELASPALPLLDSVHSFEDRAEFDVSSSGTLVYRRGAAPRTVPSWLYTSGRIQPLLATTGNYFGPRLSPDGSRLALSVLKDGNTNLWVYDLNRETWNRLTSEDGPESLPTWTPDGEFLVFQSRNTLAWTRSDGSGKVEHAAGVCRNAGPYSFSADGKWLAFWPLEPGSDLWIVPVVRTPGVLRLGQPQPLLQQTGSKGAPAISPDGRWVAYTSNASGRFEIYVMPFTPQNKIAGRKWLVSNRGGVAPRWSQNGRELFYADPSFRVQVATYAVNHGLFEIEKPRLWAEKRLAEVDYFPSFDLSPDGKRVLGLFAPDDVKPETGLHLLLNVETELRRRETAHGK